MRGKAGKEIQRRAVVQRQCFGLLLIVERNIVEQRCRTTKRDALNDGREGVDDDAMLWTGDEMGEVHWLREIGVILAETFAAVVGDFAREDFVLEDFTAELKYDGNDVAKVDVVVVFDTIDEGVDNPFDDGLTIEEALVEQHA